MPLEPLIRHFDMTYADLVNFSNVTVVNMTRDEAEFLLRGVTVVLRNAFDAKITLLENFPNDDYYRADISIAVEAKDVAREALIIIVRDVVQCAYIKWGEGSPQSRKFGTAKINIMSDKEFYTTCRQVVETATDYLADLTPVGLTQAMIDAVDDDSEAFNVLLLAVSSAVAVRDLKAQERVALANEVYALLAQYCLIGKIIWDDVDEAKYNDYVIYSEEGGSGLAAPENLAWAEESDTFSWDAVGSATSYQLSYRALGVEDWMTAYQGAPLSVVFDPGPGQWEFRVRARNAGGYGLWSDALEILVSGGLSAPQNVALLYYPPSADYLSLTWDAVVGASAYKLYQSVVNIGNPAGLYTSPEHPVSSPYVVNNPLSGKRYYYKLKAISPGEMSDFSATVFADVE